MAEKVHLIFLILSIYQDPCMAIMSTRPSMTNSHPSLNLDEPNVDHLYLT